MQTNTSVASSLGTYFLSQISLIFLDMLNVYRYQAGDSSEVKYVEKKLFSSGFACCLMILLFMMQ